MMYTIAKEDILNLHDADLRNLIGYLCIAELEAAGESPAGVTFGGNQDASDGAVDVRVLRGKDMQDGRSFVPRKQTVFQVKKPKMAPADIKKEMMSKGILKDSIKELCQNGGAYIIVSGKDDCTDSMLKQRKTAMRDCIKGQSDNCYLDFYDCSRIATWANQYPSIVIWLCNKLQKTIYAGWQKYGDWSNSKTQELIHDDGVRIKKYPHSDDAIFNMIQAIEAVRNLLKEPRNAVRLTGLSGVGKTRLLQALFDMRIGENALTQSLAIYTDMGYLPCPEPIHLAENLILSRKRAILLIDNCSPEDHRKVLEICQRDESLLSLITVEYDVREDLPQETHVFNMEPASADVMKRLLKARYPQMPDNDIYAIAKYSDGNARIAIALAEIYRPGISYVGLSDKELTDRLVFQSDAPDDKFKRIAGVLSLVYSFDGTYSTSSDEQTELNVLAKIADISSLELYEFCAELESRQLVQCRGPWKALLPHMLANNLADMALSRFPQEHILSILMGEGKERLLKSFSHRLGYLHENKNAKEISKKLLDYIQRSGYPYVDRHMHYMVNYLAPTVPQQTLELIGNAIQEGKIDGFKTYGTGDNIYLIEQLGYDAACFEQAAYILAAFAQADRIPNNNSAKHSFESYFQLYLSATMATPEQRLKVIRTFMASGNEYYRKLGLEALKTTLSYRSQFTGSGACGMPFGMRSRDYGYMPEGEEIKAWFEMFSNYACELIIDGGWAAQEVKRIFADSIRGICNCGLISIIEDAADRISEATDWFEGWLAFGEMLHFDAERMDVAYHARIVALQDRLKPSSLESRIRAIALIENHSFFRLRHALGNKENKANFEIVYKNIYDLGVELANNENVFIAILPELYDHKCWMYGLSNLGAGFAEGCTAPKKHWDKMLEVLQGRDDNHYCVWFMSGFLSRVFQKDTDAAAVLIDRLVELDSMENNVLFLLTENDKSPHCHKRIMEHLDNNPNLRWTSFHFPQNPVYETETACIELLTKLMERQEKLSTVLRLIYLSLPQDRKSESIWKEYKPALLKIIGCYVENDAELCDDNDSFMVEEIVPFAYRGTKDDSILSEIAKALYDRITVDNAFYKKSLYHAFAHSIAKVKPALLLDVFLPDNTKLDWKVEKILYNDIAGKYCLKDCDTKEVMEWAGENPTERLEKIARIINVVEQIDGYIKLTDLTQAIIDSECISERILNAIMDNFRPCSWSGDLSAILKNRLAAIEPLRFHENEIVRQWAVTTVKEVEAGILHLQRQEQEQNHRKPSSFEP